ncbi:MAG: chromosome segregation protein SMC [Anaerolineales bacterium]|nr:chromosome segregation protein SMC [Anaerolineales bacterium]
MPSRLKSLELNGYKTFASRTDFEFADTITAIVGPNGSGKSNVADSLRWVLGEQSYNLLRGRKTDDMIFSGSELRPRAGMASATIVFDNSDGWLPIDFSEVSIARRAYRDGQNEYLINNQKVRLRDVNEILAQSGLSERTYTVIGQGLVDTALSLKAEERRRLFEEAAGIGLYRSRKEQALRRLDTTKRNLERVEDILAELRPRLRSLQRQARRAEEYEQIRTDLREILREWYGFHWHRSQRELLEARTHAQVQEEHLAEAQKTQEELSGRLTTTRDHINSLRMQLNSWHRQLSQLHTNREETSRDLAVNDERQRSLVNQRNNLEAERERVAQELGRIQAQLREAEVDVQRLVDDHKQAEEQVSAARQVLQERQAARATLEAEIQSIRRQIDERNSSRVSALARKSELEGRVERYQENKASIEKETSAAEGAVRSLHAELRQAEAAQEQAEIALQQAEIDLQRMQTKLQVNEEARKTTQADISNQESKIARIEAQLEVLEQAERALAGYASGARVLLEAAKQNQLQGVKGAISNFLEVPAAYEKAIAAALGQYVDAILLDTGGSLDQALGLVTKENSRAALLPLSGVKPPEAMAVPNFDGCLGLAADLVKAPAEFRPVVDLLLGHVLIVESRAVARRIVTQMDENPVAVTLQGEVFYSSGAIIVNAEGGGGMLSRPRQRKDLSENLAKVQTELAGFQEKLAALIQENEKLSAERSQLEADVRSAREADKFARGHTREFSLQVEQARRQLAWQQNRLEEQANETAQAIEEIDQINQAISRAESETVAAEENLKEKNNALAGFSLNEQFSQVSHWEAQVAISRNALNAMQERKDEIQRDTNALRTRLAGIETGISQADARQTELREEIAGLRQSEGQVGGNIGEIHKLIEPAEKELTQAEAEQEGVEQDEAKARQELSMVERRHTQAQIALARHQEGLEGLRQRIEDDFGLVAFEYDEKISGPTPLPFAGLVEHLPVVDELSDDVEQTLKRQRAQLRRMGSINPEAQGEYQEVRERVDFLTSQSEDLRKAEEGIMQVLAELDALMEREFRKTFDVVAGEFKDIFTRLFDGGAARLILTDEEDLSNSGIDIEARLPGKRSQRLALLSGGERSLTAAALVFSLLKASPTPFCVMDEVDAMLDEANVGRFRDILVELSHQTQFVIITHNRNTVQAADIIYGITMGRDTASRMISLKFDEVDDRYSSR